jgi:hypothetical protein
MLAILIGIAVIHGIEFSGIANIHAIKYNNGE